MQKPDINELYSYIVQTHKSDRIEMSMQEIQQTLKKELINPYIEGHFKAINYLFTIADSPDFPLKDPSHLSNDYTTHTALYWLRELHTLMMYPIAKAASLGKLPLMGNIQTSHCGTYRMSQRMLAFTPAPDPQLIPRILQAWLTDISQFDAQIIHKVANPYGLSQQEAQRMFKLLKETSLFYSCLQPFEDGNNRLAKLIENALRMRWRLPWRTITGVEYESYVRDLGYYQDPSNPDGFFRWQKMVNNPKS